jgi:hypothetical protein
VSGALARAEDSADARTRALGELARERAVPDALLAPCRALIQTLLAICAAHRSPRQSGRP